MPFENDLNLMSMHLKDAFYRNSEAVIDANGARVYEAVVYGEPRVISTWPTLSVQPIRKEREIKTTHKFEVRFFIDVFVYWGKVGSMLEVQNEVHAKAEALENFLDEDRHWNFIDSSDHDKDKVIFGMSTELDHPVILTADELWSASRLQLNGLSEEVFRA